MGSFSYSCSLSGLPICSGDPVVLLPIKPRDNWYNNSESSIRKTGVPSFISNDGERVFFVEGTYPIFGTYDDYGGIENIIEDEHTKLIEEYYGVSIENFCKYM